MAGSATHRAIHLVLFDVPLEEKAMNTDPIELVDLGDAAEETKQYMPMQAFPDSTYFWGMVPDPG